MSSSLQAITNYGARIFAAQRYRLKTLMVRESLFVAVLKGSKGLHTPDSTLTARHGHGVAIARGTQWDIVNDPCGQNQYEALALSFDDELIREFNRLHPMPEIGVVDSAQVVTVGNELREAMQRTMPPAQAQRMSNQLMHHRTMEVLLHLAEQGCRFDTAEELSWSGKIRRLVAQRPHAEWNVPTLAKTFNVSESTLRRRVESGGTSLSALVREVRLETALGMLQTTGLPVGEVAQRCGWESHSRFSVVFQQRWGVSPSVVRTQMMMKESEQDLADIG